MKLKNAGLGEFVPVLDENGKKTYGGAQSRLVKKGVSKFFADRSCVVTAFTNCFLYLFRRGEEFGIDRYNKRQHVFYKIIRPMPNGIPLVKILLNAIESGGFSEAKTLKAHTMRRGLFSKKTLEEKVEFIKKGLENDSPVILLNRQSKNISFLKNHAVTITAIDKVGKSYRVTASTRGERRIFDLKKFHEQNSLYTGLVRFERRDKMKFVKFEVYVPEENADELVEKIAEKGYLEYGSYDYVHARVKVSGYFKALEGADPERGEIGEIFKANEVKLEFRVRREHKNACEKTIKENHPYEVPVINVTELI